MFTELILATQQSCFVQVDPVGIENHINNYFKQHRNNYLCRYSEDESDFVFAEYDRDNNHVHDKRYRELNKNTARALIKYLKLCFEKERQVEELSRGKRLVRKVTLCEVVDITKKRVNAVFYDNGVPITIYCVTSKIPKMIFPHVKIGTTMPIYVAKVEMNYAVGNLYSTKIPETLFKNAINKVCKENRAITPPKYLKCIKRITGVYSYILTDKRIDKELIAQIKTTLNNESMDVYHMTVSEFRGLRTGEIPIHYFIKKIGSKKYAKVKT